MTDWNKQLQNAFNAFHNRIRKIREGHMKDEPYINHDYEYIFFARDGKKIPTNWMCSYKNDDLPELFEAMIFECYNGSARKDYMDYKVFFDDFVQKIEKVKPEKERKIIDVD